MLWCDVSLGAVLRRVAALCVVLLCAVLFYVARSNPPRRGLASGGVGVLGAPDPAREAVTNYYVTPPPPPGRQPFSNPFHAAP